MSLTKATYSMIQGAAYNVLDFGADPTGVASSVAAFNAAVANGGSVYIPSGTYKLNGKVTLSVDNTTLYLAANVTLLLSGVPATQNPFGNQIHIYANDCAVIGSGPSSLLQITGGSQANAIGILHHSGLTVRDVVIDGDKAGGSAIADDTFMSAISVVVDSGQGATTDANATIDGCEMRNFLQYGVNVYGNLANGVKVVNCNIHDIGKVGDAQSVGSAIVVTSACSDFIAANNVIKNCKYSGIFISSAGRQGANYSIANNLCHQNGGSGIMFIEQSNYGSVAGVGLDGISITGNVCNGNSIHGIVVGTYNNVGLLTEISITGNSCFSNGEYGIICQSNAYPNNVRALTISGNTTQGNTTAGIAVSPNADPASVSGNINNGIPYYLAGTWTPVVEGSTSAGTGTYTEQLGRYTKIGNMLFFDFIIFWSAHTGTGNTLITGLPVPSDGLEPQNIGEITLSMPESLPVVGQYFIFIEDSNLTINVLDASTYTGPGNAPSPVPLNGAASYMRGNGWYRVAN
jgi:hypothetical protein